MTTYRSQINLSLANPSAHDTWEIVRAAELARADYLANAASRGWQRVRAAWTHVTGLFAFAQRMNGQARL